MGKYFPRLVLIVTGCNLLPGGDLRRFFVLLLLPCERNIHEAEPPPPARQVRHCTIDRQKVNGC